MSRGSEATRILLVEDEPSIADFIERGLRDEGFAVSWAADGLEGQHRALTERVDLVILDLMLPGRGGMNVLTAIRELKPTLPVIILTARADIPDRVAGLDAGATDYLTKPFAFDELAARVRARLRDPMPTGATTVAAAGIRADLLTRKVTRDGQTVSLSQREFDLLVHFLRHPNLALPRERLLQAVWGLDFDPGTNVVEVYVGYLRRKLALPERPAPIETVRSVGYRLRDDG